MSDHRLKLTVVTMVIGFAIFPIAGRAAGLNVPADKFVRSANYYLKAGIGIPSSDYDELARYDLIVLPAEAQVYNRSMFGELRRLNPNITILAYVPTKSFNFEYWIDPLHQAMLKRIQDSWWLVDSSGRQVSVWSGTKMLNMVSPWNKELPRHVSEDIWSTGLWDGIFFDEFSVTARWVNGGDIDIHRDGFRDDAELVDVAWERATINMLRETRNLLGPTAIIITNGDSATSVQPFLNGRMFEMFPTPWEGQGRWQDTVGNYLRLHDQVGYQPVFVINGSTHNTGNFSDYRSVRFALTTTLLGDGFFSYDHGDQNHGQLWWYDEQNVSLGAPLGLAVNQTLPQGAGVSPGVWRRDFRRGVVLVNSTDRLQTVDFDADLEHLHGEQDPLANNGRITNSVTLAPNDGVILLKPVENIVGSAFPNGAFARIFDQSGKSVRNGFFSYVPPFSGSDQIILQDLDGDLELEKIVGGQTEVSIFNSSGSLRTSFSPYGPDFKFGINLAIGDLDGDGQFEIVTGAGPGGEPQVRIYNIEGEVINRGFNAYDYRFHGGVQVAVGDVYGTGKAMIIVGAGPGGGPHVRVFDRWGGLWAQFFSYDWRFTGGTKVASGDLNGDGIDEIITGAGPGGGPHVRIFNGRGRSLGGFFAGDPTARNGILVATTDVNDDGIDEIATLNTNVFKITTQ
ncbi:MAG: putative glycoside hydrolase [Patescibacteria group bacterium]